MLSQTITLTLANGGTPRSVVFDRIQDFNNNRSVYMSAAHTPVQRHMLGFNVTAPKRSGKFLGAMKTVIKITQDCTVADASGLPLTSPSIGSIDLSIPVGAEPSRIDTLLDHLEDLIKSHRDSIKRSLLRSEF